MAAGAFRSASAAKAAAGSSSPSPPTPMRLPSGTRGGKLVSPALVQRKCRGRPAAIVCGQRERRPFSRPVSHHNGSHGLAGSLFSRWTGHIPEDGKFVTDEEEHCDPMHSFCGDPYYVYEAKCAPCHGTGSVRSAAGGRRGGRQSLVTCPHCHGVGVSRSVTTRFIPSEEHHGAMSLGRSVKAEKKQIGLAANPTAPRKAPSYFRRRSSSGDSSSGNGASANGNGASANGASAGDAKGSSNGNGAAASAANKDSAAGAADRKPSAAGI
eukprot:CAMPEP_0117686158 /NCGR_PEP_ID=MMETSP0804-20121206/22253_1 /TAXON_ID=1074897 /ORGANISM="Tetraselmis astigmatica, Strain CCMP880" /LENGTH=267 /DNA_ID=CAMNT_0005497737 /DNA_START=311 /DNA_END=1114 /DNA_ORIENTATION=-